MVYWKDLKYKTKELLTTFGDGINVGVPPLQIKKTEATYLRNMDSRKYPAASVRPPRSTYGATLSTSVNAIGQRNNAILHTADGNTWKYWNVGTTTYIPITTGLTSTAKGEFGEFVTGTNRFTFFMNSTQKLIWDGASTALVLGDGSTPFTNLFTVHKGRIYALKGATVSYCALNATTDWTTANDAGSISLSKAKGDGTGIYEYNDHVIVFTEYSMHELFGSGPNNYELVDVEGEIGCISDRSLVKANRRLYWLWYDGVYEYNGSTPEKISQPVDDYIKGINFTYKTKCVAGTIGDFLYLSIPYGAIQNNLILKFDTRLRKWYVEDGAFTDFVTIGNVLYGVDTAGVLWNMRDTSATEGFDSATPIPWSFITKPFNYSPQDRQTLSEMYLVADMTTSSTGFTVGFSTNINNNDSTTFSQIASLTASTNTQNTRIQVPSSDLQNTYAYRLRFAGTGYCTIHNLQENLRVKTR